MDKPFCIAPFINFAHRTYGLYQPCCEANTHPNPVNASTTYDMSPVEYFTGDEINTLRREFLSGNITDNTKEICRNCFNKEKNGAVSHRQSWNEMFNTGHYKKYGTEEKRYALLKKYEDENYRGSVEDLEWINFKILGNICNLKCLMCGPLSSSKIAVEWKLQGHQSGPAELIPFNETNKEKYLEDFKLILENINRFHFVGGEPFLNPNFLDVWNMCIESKNAKNLTLKIITNGTVLPQEVLDNAHKIGNVTILFSIDGVKERGSYVRSGLNWNDFDNNVRRAVNSKSVRVNFTSAISILNIGYINDIYNYCNQFDDISYDLSSFVNAPAGLSVWNLPNHIKETYIEKIKIIEHKQLKNLIDVLKSEQANHDEFLQGIRYLKYLDGIRNTNLIEHFSEFEEYYGL